MRGLRRRLEELEKKREIVNAPTFEQVAEKYFQMLDWLEEHGYADCLAVLEAGETGPPGFEDLIKEYAPFDIGHRAFARIEKALNSGELPDEADMRLLNPQPHQGI